MHGIEGTFDIVGARAALGFFAALPPERLGHGYCFTGPAGVGKKTFARRLAQSLLCETPKATTLGYCGRCTACALFAAGTHPDFVSSEGTIKIGSEAGSVHHDEEFSARDIVRELALHGYRGRYRVVLLGDVAFATHEAANALLKFFEEPPSGVVVLLTTSSPGTLLATIRSRFVELALPPLAAADVELVLAREGVPLDRAREAAAAALGSVVRARSILEERGDGVRDASFAWFEAAVRGGRADAGFLRLDDRSLTGAEKRANVLAMMEIVRVAARDWAALALAGADVPLLAGDQRARTARLPARDAAATVAALAAIGDAERIARTNVSASLVVDYLRMQLAPPPA